MTVLKKRSRTSVMKREDLERLYIQEGLTDKEIANKYDVDRTSVVHQRRSYGIGTRETPTSFAGKIVKDELEKIGHHVYNLKETDKLASYDLLVDNAIRIEVVSAYGAFDNSFRFSLVNSANKELIESENRIKLENGRTKKIFRNTCDFFIFCGMEENISYFWVIPSNELPDKMQTLQTRRPPSRSKYEKYVNAWDLLEGN